MIVITKSVLYWFFFFKQKTAYEMRISDWSSDVCSSDLSILDAARGHGGAGGQRGHRDPGLDERLADGAQDGDVDDDRGGAGVDACAVGVGIDVERLLTDQDVELHDAGLPEDGVEDAFEAVGELVDDAAQLVQGHEVDERDVRDRRSEEHTSELQSLMRISYAV